MAGFSPQTVAENPDFSSLANERLLYKGADGLLSSINPTVFATQEDLSNLLGDAPDALNTLGEIVAELADNESVVSGLLTTISGKELVIAPATGDGVYFWNGNKQWQLLGAAALMAVGTTAGTVAAGDHLHDSRYGQLSVANTWAGGQIAGSTAIGNTALGFYGRSNTAQGVVGISVSNVGVYGSSTSSFGVDASSVSSVPLRGYRSESVISSVNEILNLNALTSGNVTNGFGGRIRFQLKSSTTNSRDAAAVDAIWTDSTDATRTSAISFSTVDSAGALVEKLRIGDKVTITGAPNTGNGLRINTPTGFGAGYIDTMMGNTPFLRLYQSSGNWLALDGSGAIQSYSPGTVPRNLSLSAAGGNTGVGTINPLSKLHVVESLALTNTINTILTISHNSSGAASSGFGSGQLFQLKSSTTNDREASTIDTVWTDATDATRTSAFTISTVSSGGALAERLRASGTYISAAAIPFQSLFNSASTGVDSGLELAKTSGGNTVAVGSGLAISFRNRESGGLWSYDQIINRVYASSGGIVTSGYEFTTHQNQNSPNTSVVAMAINGRNVGIGTTTEFGSGVGVFGIANAVTVPTTNPTGGVVFYSEAGILKWRGSDGTVYSLNNTGGGLTQGDADLRYGQLAAANSWSGGTNHFTALSGTMPLTVSATGVAAARLTSDTGPSIDLRTNTGRALQMYLLALASNSTVSVGSAISARAAGTPVDGFGVSQLFQLKSSTTNDRDAGSMDVRWTNAVDATRRAAFVFSTVNSGGSLIERFRINENGITLTNSEVIPTTNPVGGGIAYSEGGQLKWRRTNGTVDNLSLPTTLTNGSNTITVDANGGYFNTAPLLVGDGSQHISYREPWASLPVYQSEFGNSLFAADKRFNVTSTGFSQYNSLNLFNSAYSGSSRIDAGGVGVITIDLLAKGEIPQWITYCQGFIWVTFYHVNFPDSVTMRTLNRDGVWASTTGVAFNKGTFKAFRIPVGTSLYLTQIEITITAQATVNTQLTGIEYQRTRLEANVVLPVLDKFSSHKIYYPWQWTDSDNVMQAEIRPDGTLFGNSFNLKDVSGTPSTYATGGTAYSQGGSFKWKRSDGTIDDLSAKLSQTDGDARYGQLAAATNTFTGAQLVNTTANAIRGIATNGYAVFAQKSGSGQALWALSAGNTVLNAPAETVTIGARTSSTPTNGFGVRTKYTLQSSTSSDRDAAAIDAVWTDFTDATRTSVLTLSTVSAAGALTERVRFGGGFNLQFGSGGLKLGGQGANQWVFVHNTLEVFSIGSGAGIPNFAFSKDAQLRWGGTSNDTNSVPDVGIAHPSAGTLRITKGDSTSVYGNLEVGDISAKRINIVNDTSNLIALSLQAAASQSVDVVQFKDSAGTVGAKINSFLEFSNSVGTNVEKFGDGALRVNTGGGNTAFGYRAMYANTTGINNTAFGRFALGSNLVATGNTAIGYNVLQNVTAGGNTAVGHLVLQASTGMNNTAMGYRTMYLNTSGNHNTALGWEALFNNLTGQSNVALGYKAGYNQTSGTGNIMIGLNSDVPNLTGNSQISIANVIYGIGTNNNTFKFGLSVSAPAAKLHVFSTEVTTPNVRLEAMAAQTGDFIQAINSSGISQFSVSASGVLNALSYQVNGVAFTDIVTKSVGTTAGTVAAGNDARITAYDVALYVPGLLPSGGVVLQFKATREFTLPANLAGSVGGVDVYATSNTTLDIRRRDTSNNVTSIGSIVFAAGSLTPTFTFTNPVTFSVGDVISVVAPTPADATLSGIYVTLKGAVV